MVKLIDKQNTFNAGVITTKLLSRDDLKQFNNGLSDAHNFVCSKYGPITKRVGTTFIWDLGNPDEIVRYLPFVFNVKQSLVLEFIPKAIRFYSFDGESFGPIEDPNNPGVPYKIETEFTEDIIPKLSFAQSLDVIYLAFPGGKTKPMELRRYANDRWELHEFKYDDGPYLDVNYDQTKTAALSAASAGIGSHTLTLVGHKMDDSWVGRHVRLNFINTTNNEDRWSWGIITKVDSETSATIDMKVKSYNTAATTTTSSFRLGTWFKGGAYPTKVTIHEQRLTWSGMYDSKPWIWMSNGFTYGNYSPSDYNGVISDRNAIYYDASTEKISDIFWIKSLKSLLIGTEMYEMRMYSAGPTLAPADAVVSRESSYGSYDAEPIITDDVLMFIQRLQRTLRAVSYDRYSDMYLGPELSVLAESLTVGGIKRLAYQKEPNSMVWMLKEDGTLLTMTYDKAQDVIAWSRCSLGGENVEVMDIIDLPSNTFKQDVVVFAVNRTVNGVKKRYMELLSRDFIDSMGQEEAVFMDCSQRFRADLDENGKPIPTDSIGGLWYLEGEEVTVTDQGAYLEKVRVKNGEIKLSAEVTDAWVGYAYPAHFDTLFRDFQDKQISTYTSKLRFFMLVVHVIRTLGLEISQLVRGFPTVLRTFDPTSRVDTVPVAVTGAVNVDMMPTWSQEYRLRFTSKEAMPCTISGIINGLEINAK